MEVLNTKTNIDAAESKQTLPPEVSGEGGEADLGQSDSGG